MSNSFFYKSRYTLFFLVFFSAVSVPVFYHLLSVEKRLKIYNPIDINPRLVDSTVKHIQKNHTIANFQLINQNGDTITQQAYAGKIYVADFFFTRCQTICLAMAYNMSELQTVFKDDTDIQFLSHSVTPVMDSVPVLKAYALNKGVIDGKWHVTTGNKKHIYDLARKSYFAVLEEGDGGVDDFIHTENFILIDKERRIRGIYDGTDREKMQQIIKDIALLKKEYEE